MNENTNHTSEGATTTTSPIDSHEIGLIAACLADNFLKPLYDFCSKHNLHGYIGTLNVVSEWAHDFYDIYNEKIADWESFESSGDNIYESIAWDDFVISWGRDLLEKFLKENGLVSSSEFLRTYEKSADD